MASKYRKRCLTPLIIREIPIKATLRDHLTPVRIANIKKKKKKKMSKITSKDMEKLELGALLVRM